MQTSVGDEGTFITIVNLKKKKDIYRDHFLYIQAYSYHVSHLVENSPDDECAEHADERGPADGLGCSVLREFVQPVLGLDRVRVSRIKIIIYIYIYLNK